MNEDLPKDPAPAELSNIEAINNLDTARMALRWALERLHALQQLNEDAQRRAEASEGALRQADTDRKDIQRVLELRGQEDAQRSAYYAKLEHYLSQQFAGKLDLAALIKREVQVAELESMLHERQLHLEKEYAARREKLETQAARAKFDAEQSAAEQVARAQASVLESRQNLERSFAVKLSELTDKEVRLRGEAEALAQRQSQFEGFCREQRSRLEFDIKAFHDSAAEQLELRIDSSERFMAGRHEAAASIWSREKTALVKEIDDWREKALAYLPKVCELEKQLLEAQEAAQKAKLGAELEGRHLKAEYVALQTERVSLAAGLSEARQRHETDLPQLLEAERGLADAAETCRRLEAALGKQKAANQSLQGELAQKEADFRKDLESLEAEKRRLMEGAARRLADIDALESLLVTRFRDLEDEIHQRDQAWREREELNRRRDRDWHSRLSEWQAELTRKAGQLETLKSSLIETIRTYRAKMGQKENPEPQGESGGR